VKVKNGKLMMVHTKLAALAPAKTIHKRRRLNTTNGIVGGGTAGGTEYTAIHSEYNDHSSQLR
jgi:hypothetical protein